MVNNRSPARRYGFFIMVRRFAEDIKLLVALIRDFWKGRYRQVPLRAILIFALTVLYIVFPFDLLPDVIPGYGRFGS